MSRQSFNLPKTLTRELLKNFLMEDEGYGDITSNLLVPKGKQIQAHIFTKEECVLSGVQLLCELFEPEGCKVILKAEDGELLKSNQDIALISGAMRGILLRERLALNLLSRMCGIATKTRSFVQQLPKHSKTLIAATRKTTPGLRLFEKYAVTCGGGDTHRLRLDDMVLIKDNHRVLFKSISDAVKEVRAKVSFSKKIEVEVEDYDTMIEAVEAGADIIMLDNMSPKEVAKAIDLLKEKGLRDKVLLEVSGGINEKNVGKYAKLNPDILSAGALTHSYKSIDLSLEMIK